MPLTAAEQPFESMTNGYGWGGQKQQFSKSSLMHANGVQSFSPALP